jgi:hypothetical protein
VNDVDCITHVQNEKNDMVCVLHYEKQLWDRYKRVN